MLQKKAFEAAQLAALEGRLVPEIKTKILEQLAAVYFDRDKIQLTGTTTTAARGEQIEITLQYP